MKQHITKKQFQELSKKDRGIIDRWSKRKPLLSIGMMIEFLGSVSIWNYNGLWFVDRDFNKDSYKYKELVDALWEAVKEVLNKE